MFCKQAAHQRNYQEWQVDTSIAYDGTQLRHDVACK